MLERLIADARRIPPRRRIMMLVALVVAAGYLSTLKNGADQEKRVLQEVKQKQAEQREATNGEINAAMKKDFGGVSTNQDQIALVARVAAAVIGKTDAAKTVPPMRVTLLAEPNHINLYALSSGEVYITTALLNRMQTEGQLAAMIAHAAAHAMAGDGLMVLPANAKIPKPMWQYRPEAVKKADVLTVKLMSQAGYDPNAFGRALAVLAEAYHAGADASFFTTHPSAADRQAGIDAAIKLLYPDGLPAILSK